VLFFRKEAYYYHTDHLQSSTIITDQNGVNVEQMFYYPYGEMTGYHTGSVNVKHKFNGHEYDGESGLYYMGARYYDPKLARFISADTIVPMPFYPQSLNRYSFTMNNPVVLRELDGNCFAGPSSAPSSFFSSMASMARSVARFVGGAISAAISAARAAVNIVVGGATLAAGVATGILTGGNRAAVNAVISGGQSFINAIDNGANGAITALGGGGGPFIVGGSGGGGSGYDNYAANDNGTATDAGRELTIGEQFLQAALDYKGEKGWHCNELVIQSIKDTEHKVDYFNTRNIGDSPYFRQLAVNETPRTGDIAVWSGKHMGFYVSPSLGYFTEKGITANIFHSPGAGGQAVGFGNINAITNYSFGGMSHSYYRYTGN